MDLVVCHHPDLPGQPVLMAKPRNGWVAEEANIHPPTPSPTPGEADSPHAGTSTTTSNQE